LSLANGFVLDRVWCSNCHALLRSARPSRSLRRISATLQIGILAAAWAALFTSFGSNVFQAVGIWVLPMLILASGAIHLILSAAFVLLFARRIQLEVRGGETRAA
jgi:hypothetical protein